MHYSKVQNKVTCGNEERVVDEVVYFHFDGHDKTVISTFLSHSSIIQILNCFFKSVWNRKAIREKAISRSDSRKRYEKTQHELLNAYRKKIDESECKP